MSPGLLRLPVLAAGVGVLSGFGSFAFLRSLDWATSTRLDNGWLVWLLPLAGLAIGAVHHLVGGPALRGTNLILDEAHEPTPDGPPRRMAPLVLAGATITHLFGGSGGREGAAVQIAASLTSHFRSLRRPEERRDVMIAAIAGGFGSVFGVPFAGAVFGVEVPTFGRVRLARIWVSATASFTGHATAVALGLHHGPAPRLRIDVSFRTLIGVVAFGVAFGVAAAVFIEAVHGLRGFLRTHITWTWMHPAIGGASVLLLFGLAGTRAYLGLSLPLLDAALLGNAVASAAFAWKLVFTATTIGSGFPGGEVTPLFCTGACLGSVLAHALHVDRGLFAAIGMLAVFAAASKTPLACTVVGVELFGVAVAPLVLCACVIACVVSGNRSVYGAQRVARNVRTWRRLEPVPTMAALDRFVANGRA